MNNLCCYEKSCRCFVDAGQEAEDQVCAERSGNARVHHTPAQVYTWSVSSTSIALENRFDVIIF